MPSLFALGGANTDAAPSDQDHHLAKRVGAFRTEFKSFLEHLKHIILIPLSWFLTLVHFASILLWRIFTLPLRFAVNFYELQIRRKFPWLPSIWKTLQTLFPSGIKIPTLTSLTAGPYKGAGPSGSDLPTLDASAEIDAIINSGGNGNGNASSPIESSRSKLEIALKKIPATSPGDLETGLAEVKAAQAETEKVLESLNVS